ncbi:glycosyltransferase family 2 protein [Parabacteroides sp. GYB001]|uniref:glycosyltransferase family 2 protein n=1 Tax=Parabacteroides leei TaxID=2939491 RepID=UPI0020177A32|nr:glycosyltransferase family 2 protein [Parabacteroides leei]MCL3853353.1 glycosyltransferase family 2 protein [Parabacteroides leei]
MDLSVSLIITTYNWKEALRLTLLSVFTQTVLPQEVLIADDGSGPDTKELIDSLRKESPVPLVHVWHEDEGFRLTTIRNKAIARAKGDYIVQVDGDTILNEYFIEDHIELAEEDCFVCGSRVKIFQKGTKRIMEGGTYDFRFFRQSTHSMLNSIRLGFLRRFLARNYAKDRLERLRGCNMAFWKKDLIQVNGYNEDLTSWGHEDTELSYRLFFAGKEKKILKMGGVLFHLHHDGNSRHGEDMHLLVIEDVKKNNSSWCENGLNKYN